MKTESPNPTPILTERELYIAEQVKRLRDLQARRDVLGGGSSAPSRQYSSPIASRSEVKDSHDR